MQVHESSTEMYESGTEGEQHGDVREQHKMAKNSERRKYSISNHILALSDTPSCR